MIRCIIVDDEPLSREGLKDYVTQVEFLELVGSFKNAIQASNFIHTNAVDLLFLDIEMPKLSGVDFLKSTENHPPVIFTTAYSEYALESYEFDVIDYLVKPISFERFLQAANKAFKRFRVTTATSQTQEIFIKTDQKLVRIAMKDILFIEGMQNYQVVHTTNEKLITLIPLKNAFKLLPEDRFIQTHKSFIVNRNQIEAIVGNEIMIKGHRVPISHRMRSQVLEALTHHKLMSK